MLIPTLDEYAKKYEHIKFHREDGILQISLHTDGQDLIWGFPPHQELGYCFADIASDPENKVIILTGSGETFIHKEDLGGGEVDAKVWVEHVLPRSWGEQWPYEDGSTGSSSDETVEAMSRNRELHTLGNLTLLTSGLNISSGNKSLAEKKAKFEEHTGLFLNKWFKGKPRWTEAEIRERGEKLADMAVIRWPGLENIT